MKPRVHVRAARRGARRRTACGWGERAAGIVATPLALAVLAAVALPAAPAARSTLSAQAREMDYHGHFAVFTGQGRPASLDDIAAAMKDAEAVLVGEIHTDPVGHWIEAELLRRALQAFHVGQPSGALRPVALSLEMFERDVQDVLDEYLADLITEKQFKAGARPWEYYDSDYRPMVEAAKAAHVPVIAANAPRRYVNRVTRLGRDALLALPDRARSFLAPLPYPQPTDAYRAEWNALMSDMPTTPPCTPPMKADAAPGGGAAPHRPSPKTAGAAKAPPAHKPRAKMPMHNGSFMENALQAQTLWDATMAYAVTTYLEDHPGGLVLHMVGGFHVQNFTGIPEKIEFYRPGTRRVVVSMDTADDFATFDASEYAGRGDFVILTDKSLDQDYARNCLR